MNRRMLSATSLFVVLLLLIPTASVPVLAQSGETTSITHRQSVRTEMDATGAVTASRIFTQLTVQGDGEVEVTLPAQSTRGLRNLDGFGRPQVDGDEVVFNVAATTDGASARTVADHRDPSPIELEVAYRLDGQQVEPREVVGRSGELEVSFTARNTTSEPVEVNYRDGRNQRRNETIEVAVPFVGSVSMELDGRFVGIDAPGASVAGNGRGDTFVSWSMVLFSPVGSEEQTVSYTAQVTDAYVPDVVAQFLPVDSDSFGSLASVQDSFGAVSDGLRELTVGAMEINANLTALAIGVGQLFTGIGRLSRGGGELAEGLNETAVPGARQLADGTGAARDGSRALTVGANTAREGGRELAAGAGQASSGSRDLADGAAALSDGLSEASAGGAALAEGLTGAALPGAQALAEGLGGSAAPGAAELQAGLDGLLTAFGSSTEGPGTTVLGGLATLLSGLSGDLAEGTAASRQLSAGLAASFGPDSAGIDAGMRAHAAAGGAKDIADGAGALQAGADQVLGALGMLEASLTGAGPDEQALIDAIRGGVTGLRAGAQGIEAGALELHTGLSQQATALGSWPADCTAAITAVRTSPNPSGLQVVKALSCITTSVDAGLNDDVIPGVRQLQAGLDNPACNPGDPRNPANPCGVKQVLQLLEAGATDLSEGLGLAAAGAGDLATGLVDASDGSTALSRGLVQLEDGGRQLRGGAGQLSSGLGQIDDGANRLADGLGELSDGAGQLADGLVQIDDGANQLATGLGDAGDGATQVAEGLRTVEDALGGAAEGSQRLIDEGMDVLIASASDATSTPAVAVEQAIAADARGRAGEGLPYGTPDGAVASAVYQFELTGVGATDDGPPVPVRALATLLGLVLASGLALALRRRIP